MAGKQDKISHICQESCSLFSYSIAKVLLYVFVQESYYTHKGNPVLNIQIGGQWCIDGSSIYVC